MGRNEPMGIGNVGTGEEFPVMTSTAAPGTTITTTFLPPVTMEEERAALETARRARWNWPYLSLPLSKASNGRETGAFIAGLMYTRSSQWAGMSVDVLETHVAGCLAMLFEAGIAVSPGGVTPFQEEGAPKRVRMDCWIETGGEQSPTEHAGGSGVAPEIEVTISAPPPKPAA